MEQLETTGFNEVVMSALDRVYGSLESERFMCGDIAGTAEVLDTYSKQMRCIRSAAGAVGMPGLSAACMQIERNVLALLQQQRRLANDEIALLSAVPELLAQYALNLSTCKVDSLIDHLLEPAWPLSLQTADLTQLRHLLETDPGVPRQDLEECAALAGANFSTMEMDCTDDANETDPRTALHDALDALIVSINDEQAFGASDADDAQTLACYATKLEVLSTCAAQAGVAALAKACDVFAQVVIRRAADRASVTEAERGLLSLFPILTMDSIADPDDSAAGSALLALVNDPLWDRMQLAASVAVPTAAPTAVASAVVNEVAIITPAVAPVISLFPAATPVPPSRTERDIEPAASVAIYLAAPEVCTQQISLEMLSLLSREIAMLEAMLSEDLVAVLAAEPDSAAYHDALANFAEALGRVGSTAESVGLVALQRWFGQLTHLLLCSPRGVSSEQQPLLSLLMPRLAHYLSDPCRPEHGMPLVAMLSDTVWGDIAIDAEAWLAALAAVELIEEQEVAPIRQTTASEEDVCLAMPDDVNPELLEGLLHELPVQVARFTDAIACLAGEQGTMADLEQATRASHTLKGAANTVGVVGIGTLTHHLEEILLQLSAQQCLPDTGLATLLTEAADCLEAMAEAVMGTGPVPQQARQLLQRVLDHANGMAAQGEADLDSGSAPPPETPDGSSHADDSVAAAELKAGTPAAKVLGKMAAPLHTGAQQQDNDENTDAGDTAADANAVMRVPAPVVDELLRLAGENIISNSQLQEQLRLTQRQSKAIGKQDTLFQKLIAELENLVDIRGMDLHTKAGKTDDQFDPLEFERYNELHTITCQLIEASTDSRQMAGQIDEQLNVLNDLLQVQRRLQLENQHAVVRTRLVPVSSVVSRLQRCVRQACRVLGKQVSLTIVGETTNIDSHTLHELIDPLMHMLRNAVDHGIEASEVRQANGKSPAGQVTLQFSSEGNSIVVRCTDDGAGLDYPAIHRIALRKNLLAADRVVSDEELARVILMPGFSTREASTQLSGRGIGMDAVLGKVLELKGTLSLTSSPNQGMTVTLRLPTTLLSEHTLMARVHGKLLAISSRRIVDLHYITQEQIDVIGTESMYRLGDTLHKVFWLDQLLGITGDRHDAPQAGYPALLTSTDSGETCVIVVQELTDGRESVVKKLGRYVPKIPGTIGAVILGDGSVAPVLDIQELLRALPQQRAMHTGTRDPLAPAVPATRKMRSALVVDDSLSARRATAQTLRDAGFEVRTATDGMDAVALLDKSIPDVILVDMEMPRMNGLELTAHVRARADTKHLPIIMITSRSTEKHRQQGSAAGVNAYMLKPFNEDQLMEQLDHLLGAYA